jgi:hypothetical protein
MSFFRGGKGATPTNAEEPLLGPAGGPAGGTGGGSPAPPGSYRRSGPLGSLKNAVRPLTHPEKRKERLIKGAQTGNLEMVKQALNDGADIEANPFDHGRLTRQDITPLHHACINGHLDVVRELLKRGAAMGPGLLLSATNNNHLDVVRELLSGEGHPGA